MARLPQFEPLPGPDGGYALFELLIAIVLFSLISTSGFKLISIHLENRNHQLAAQVESLTLEALVQALQRSFDQRYLNPFPQEPWLRTDALPMEDGFILDQVEIRILKQETVQTWTWKVADETRVYIKTDSLVCHSGQAPRYFIVKFPDSSILRFRQGISIEGL